MTTIITDADVSGPFNVPRLVEELDTAGLDSRFRLRTKTDGTVYGEFAEDNRAALLAVLDAHDSTLLTAQQAEDALRDELVAGIKARIAADGQLEAFMSMAQQDALDYINTNVVDLASAKALLLVFGKLFILLRDAVTAEIVAELRGQ